MAGGMRGDLTARPVKFIPTLIHTPLVINVGSPAVGIPSTWIPAGTSGAYICCDTLGGGVKFAFVGAADISTPNVPTTQWGYDLGPGQAFTIRDNIDLINKIQFFAITGTAGRISFLPFTE